MRTVIQREPWVFWGAVLGLVITVVASMESTRWNDPAVAKVNGVAIPQAAFDLAVKRFQAGSRDEKTAALQFLVDEELLVQRAEEVGLLDHDRAIKKAVVRAVIDRINDHVRALGQDSNEVRAFWQCRPTSFLRAASTEQALALAHREFRIRYPDVLLRELLVSLRARAHIEVPDAKRALKEVAVRVNGTDIPIDLVDRFLDALVENRRDRPSQRDLQYALDRVVDEELLFQHGLEVGLHKSERHVRAVISKTMLDTITMDFAARPAVGAAAAGVGTYLERLRLSARIEWPDWIVSVAPEGRAPS